MKIGVLFAAARLSPLDRQIDGSRVEAVGIHLRPLFQQFLFARALLGGMRHFLAMLIQDCLLFLDIELALACFVLPVEGMIATAVLALRLQLLLGIKQALARHCQPLARDRQARAGVRQCGVGLSLLVHSPRVGNLNNRMDILDMTVATTFELGDRAKLATGFSFPLKGSSDRTFDWEFHLQFNYYFGSKGNRSAPN